MSLSQSPMRFGARVGGLGFEGARVAALGGEALGPEDRVVLAVPAPVAGGLVPGLVVPDRFEAILNVHYRTDARPGEAGFMGLVNSLAEWVFVKPGIVSVTVSAANRHAGVGEDLAQQVWADVQRALKLEGNMPPHRVIREKRATFAATPEQDGKRPGVRTAWANLALAGDWTSTGLPATIEGAIRSGRVAAGHVLQGLR